MSKVTFGGRSVSVFGMLAGVLIAVGVSAMALLTPQDIGAGARVTITIIALIAGGAVALTAAFFGTVIPREVEDDDKVKGGVHVDFGNGGMSIHSDEKPKSPDSPPPSSGDAVPKA